jgi:O-methyltransferase
LSTHDHGNVPKKPRGHTGVEAKASRKAEVTRLLGALADEFGLEVNKRGMRARFRTLLDSNDCLQNAWKKIDIRTLEDFGPLAAQIVTEGRTAMSYDRLYTIWQALRGAPKNTIFAEVGAYRGGSAKFIAECLCRAGRVEPLYVCDTFAGHPRVDSNLDGPHDVGGKFTDTSAEAVAAYLAPYPNVRLLVGDFVETSAKIASAGSFGCAHIDVDVYEATGSCLRFFAPRLAPGAFMIVDDYGFLTCAGARKAVDEFVAGDPTFRFLHLITGQAVIFRAG